MSWRLGGDPRGDRAANQAHKQALSRCKIGECHCPYGAGEGAHDEEGDDPLSHGQAPGFYELPERRCAHPDRGPAVRRSSEAAVQRGSADHGTVTTSPSEVTAAFKVRSRPASPSRNPPRPPLRRARTAMKPGEGLIVILSRRSRHPCETALTRAVSAPPYAFTRSIIRRTATSPPGFR